MAQVMAPRRRRAQKSDVRVRVEASARADAHAQLRPAVWTTPPIEWYTSFSVRTTPTLGNQWLLPRLRGFLDANPDIEFHLNATTEPTDFTREAVDLEIRHGEGRWPGMFVEGLAEEAFLPVCAPACAAAASLTAADLPAHRLIHSVKSQVQWSQWFALAGAIPAVEWRRLLFDRSHMAIDAAVDGLGVALESTLMMWRELREGSLVCPVIHPPRVTLTTQWIVCPFDHLHKATVRLFLDWLRAERVVWQSQRPPLDGMPTS